MFMVNWAESLDTLSYYRVLRVPETADASTIKKGFHELAVHCHPDQYIDGDPVGRLAAERIFKCAVEAYSILCNPEHRRRYDAGLRRNILRLDPSVPEEKAKIAAPKTVLSLAQTPDGRRFAAKADAFIEAKQWENARIALVDACQREPSNEALKARLRKIYDDMR